MMADTGSSARQDEITLFDLPSRPPGGCWSLNPWKSEQQQQPIQQVERPDTDCVSARMALNYKGLAYKTIWVEYPDVQPLLKPQSVRTALFPPSRTDLIESYPFSSLVS